MARCTSSLVCRPHGLSRPSLLLQVVVYLQSCHGNSSRLFGAAATWRQSAQWRRRSGPPWPVPCSPLHAHLW